MAKILNLPTYKKNTGSISVVERILPFTIKRVYYIYDISGNRGGHAHKKNKQALIAINGNCKVFVKNKKINRNFILNNKKKILLLNPADWHLIKNCSKNLVLLVLASKNYDPKDYTQQEIV